MKPITRIKIKLFIFDRLFDLLILTCIGICAYFNDRFLEALYFLIVWLVFRTAYPKIYHFKHSIKAILNLLGCILCTTGIFWFVIPNMLPLSVSIFSSVFFGVLVNYVLFKLQDYIDLRIEKAKNDKFNCDTCTREELITRCLKKGFSPEKTERAIMHFIDKKPHKEIDSIRPRTSEVERKRMRNKLNSPL